MIRFIVCFLMIGLLLHGTACKKSDVTLPGGAHISVSVAHTGDTLPHFTPPAEWNLVVQNRLMSGSGTPEDPFRYRMVIKNSGSNTWQGMVKVDVVSELPEARFFLPGYMYGTNRGDAPVDARIKKQHPRLRKGEPAIPFSPYWLMRSDQLTHPVAAMHSGNHIYAIAVSPYFTSKATLWQPTDTSRNLPWVYNGFGCSVENNATVSMTLGYANAPVLYETPYRTVNHTANKQSFITLSAGEEKEVDYKVYAYPSPDAQGVNSMIKNVYYAYRQAPGGTNTARQMAEDVTNAMVNDAYSPEQKTYALIWSFPEGLRYAHEGLIAWTNGSVIAYPLLMAAHRLHKPEYRAQALEVINHIVQKARNPASGLPNAVCENNEWHNKGWWWKAHTSTAGLAPDHSSYVVGQAFYYILQAYRHEKIVGGIEHPEWLQFVKSGLQITAASVNEAGAFPQFWSEKDGKGYGYDAFSGSWCVAAMVLYSQVTNDTTFLPLAGKSELFYRSHVRNMECYNTPLDVWDAPDSEGILAYIRAVKILHELTGKQEYAEALKMGLDYELSFKYAYNLPIAVHPLDTIGFYTSGGSITSVGNAVQHCMSNTILDEMLYYYQLSGDTYYMHRLQDTYRWGLQTYNSKEGKFGFGKKGWSTEYFAQAERYVLETRFEDGSWSNVWQAYHPWATAAVLEGMCGALWEKEWVQRY